MVTTRNKQKTSPSPVPAQDDPPTKSRNAGGSKSSSKPTDAIKKPNKKDKQVTKPKDAASAVKNTKAKPKDALTDKESDKSPSKGRKKMNPDKKAAQLSWEKKLSLSAFIPKIHFSLRKAALSGVLQTTFSPTLMGHPFSRRLLSINLPKLSIAQLGEGLGQLCDSSVVMWMRWGPVSQCLERKLSIHPPPLHLHR